MAVYMIPVFLVSILLIAFVIVYVILARSEFKKTYSKFPEGLIKESDDRQDDPVVEHAVREEVETLPDEDDGEPYIPDDEDADDDIFDI